MVILDKYQTAVPDQRETETIVNVVQPSSRDILQKKDAISAPPLQVPSQFPQRPQRRGCPHGVAQQRRCSGTHTPAVPAAHAPVPLCPYAPVVGNASVDLRSDEPFLTKGTGTLKTTSSAIDLDMPEDHLTPCCQRLLKMTIYDGTYIPRSGTTILTTCVKSENPGKGMLSSSESRKQRNISTF